MNRGKPTFVRKYRTLRLVDSFGEQFDVEACETSLGWQGWYFWFKRQGPEITWIRGWFREVKNDD